MAKRKKRVVATKKKKEEVEDNDDDIDEPAAKKVAVSSSTTFLEDDSSQTSFNVEGVNIGKSDRIGGEVGFSSHFWCNYCEYSSDTKKELVTHMRQHMTKCSYCNFSSLSRAEIAKHVKCEHIDEAEKAICEVDSSSSGMEHDMDKDPCSACIFCDFMTYSTEHLEKHTSFKHKGMLPKSVAKMISKQVSARIRRDDAMFYCAISSDSFDKPITEGENAFSSKAIESEERKGPILIEPEPQKPNLDVKPNISPQSPEESSKPDVKPIPQTLSQTEIKDSFASDKANDMPKIDEWKVKVETLYCLSCPYSNVAIEKLKCHALTQHPESVAAASFTSEASYRLQDITFYCARESCSYTSVQCGDYEDHLMKCCSPPDSLLFGEKERLADTIKFMFKCQEKQGATKSKDFIEFSSQYVSHPSSFETPSSPISPPASHSHIQSNPLSNNSNQCNQYLNNANSSSHDNSNSSHSSSTQAPIQANVSYSSNNAPQTPSFENNSNSNKESNNFDHHQTHGQTQKNVSMGQHISNPGLNSSTSVGGQTMQTSSKGEMQEGQTTMNNDHSIPFGNRTMQVFSSAQSDNNYHQNSSPPPFSNNSQQNQTASDINSFHQTPNTTIHNQVPVGFNFNTNTVSSGQQHMYPPHPAPNPEPILAPSFDSQFSVVPGGQNNNQSSFTSHQQNNQLQQQQQAVYPNMNPTMTTTTNNQPVPTPSNLYPNMQSQQQQPKMLDLLSDASAILLDNDLSIQPWPESQSNDPLPPQHAAHGQSSLHTPPLPQDTVNNPPIYPSTNFEGQHPLPASSSFSQPNASSAPNLTSSFTSNTETPLPHVEQTQHPPVQPSLMQPEAVIDLDSPQTYDTALSSQHALQNPVMPMNYVNHYGNTSENPPLQNASHHQEAAASVPNFLVPSSSGPSESMPNNTHHPNSFLSNSIPPQSLNHQTHPTDYPSTPPSQKNIPGGTPRFPAGNSPLSPSIYLNGNPPPSPMTQQFGSSPQSMNPNPNNQQPTSNVRQRLFTRGQPRGPGMQNRMVRPPNNPADDDVIVTAVVRGPAPQRPPASPRGRGMAPNPRGMAPNPRGMAPNQRGMAPNQRGMAPNQRGMRGGRGMAPGVRGMSPRGRGMDPGGRGMAPGGRGYGPSGRGMSPRGRAGMPVQRGRGGMPRGRGGPLPPNMSPQGKRPFDVSRHFVDLACVVNSNEEEGDEIQIVGVTPGNGSQGPPKAVDAKQFSYCCIHCGQDQGSKEVMKKHIKSSHCDSLLGAFRNVETGQWLYFCPQLTCEFMTYDENRLNTHLFACYNLDNTKPLPYDMQSALKNLKSLKIRHVNAPEGVGRSMTNPIDLEGQGLRDAFNNNLKDAFDDMVENTMGRQMMRPNQPSRPPNQRPPPPANRQPSSPSYTSQRGAMRGPYRPRGTPPKNVRQGFPGPGQTPPGFRQRSPMMGGSPQHVRYPGRPRAPVPTRGMTPGRGGPPPMRGQRPPISRGGFMPRPNLATPGMPGNEQSPIVIDLDVDSPGKVPEDNSDQQESASAIVTPNNPMDISTLANALIQPPPPNQITDNTVSSPLSSIVADNRTGSQQTTDVPLQANESVINPTPDAHSQVRDQTTTLSPSHQSSSVVESGTNGNSVNSIPTESCADTNNELNAPSHANPETLTENIVQVPVSSSQAPVSDSNVPVPMTSVKNVPSPSQLLAEMNAMSNKQTIPQPPQEQSAQAGAVNDLSPTPDNDEELVNKILLDKVFAKVPQMPKKLSQRLVLKFKKYAADRGMVITPTSRVIDEFVSKISYKGSHSAPTPIGGHEKPSSETNQPTQPSSGNNNARNNSDTGPSSNNSISHQPSANQRVEGSDIDNQNSSSVSSAAPIPGPNQSYQMLSSSSSPPSTNNDLEKSPTDVARSDDVIETKVIFAERKIQFKGAFANIIKEKNTQNSNSVPSPIPANGNISSENSPQEIFENLPQSVPSPSPGQSKNGSVMQSSSDSIPPAAGEGHDMIAKTLKKEIIEPVSFPSISKENTIEVKSSVDHIVCGHASLEVDIAGKPLSASAFNSNSKEGIKGSMEGCENDKALSPTSKSLHDKDQETTGTLKFKIKKGTKPRVIYTGKKEDEIVLEKYEDSGSGSGSLTSLDDQCIRRSERKRKAVKLNYNAEELGEMEALMSDEDDEYHIESDESYDGSDSDGWGKKKAKKTKSAPDPTAFDLSTKGCFGCWKCNKVFSRVMFLKRHILKKHKEDGLCAIVLTETGIPSKDQPTLLLFCPQSCKYVTGDCDAFGEHLENCARSPLNVADIDYKSIQESFFKSGMKLLLESIASGSVSTKIPVKPPPVPRRKSLVSPHPPADPGSRQDKADPTTQATTTTIVTKATIHHPPPQPPPKILHPPSHPAHPHHTPTHPHPHPTHHHHHHPPPVLPDMSIEDVPEDDGHDSYYQHDDDMPEDGDPESFYPQEEFYPQ